MGFFRNTLGQKILCLYLVVFMVGFYFVHSFGYDYIRHKVILDTKNQMTTSGNIIIKNHIEMQSYTPATLPEFYSQIRLSAETSDCRVLIVNTTGGVLLDTSNMYINDNVNRYDSSFLKKKYVTDLQLGSLVSISSLCVSLPIENCVFINGYLVMLTPMTSVDNRVNYYFNIIDGAFYLIMFCLAIVFLILYITNTLPLRKLIYASKGFSIKKENEPIVIRTNDEYRDMAETLNVIAADMSSFDEYQKKFIANISHDFRSPLTSIRGYAEAMIDGTIPPESQEKYLNIILFETERLNHLTSNLLELNTFENESVILDKSVFDIHDCIIKTADSLEGAANRKNLRIELKFNTQLKLEVNADIGKIQQVLHNLLDNAIKFSRNDSFIEVRTKRRGERIFVSVKDFGVGIPKDSIAKIWERFYKTDVSRGRDKKGTGLGLCICKEILNAHGQTINVVSTEGVGSEFIFTLQKA